MPPVVSYSQTPLFFVLGLAILILFIVFVLHLIRMRKEATRRVIAVILATGIGMAVLASLFTYAFNASYVAEHTWSFAYGVSVETDSATPDAVVVSSIADDSLLSGLTLDSGIANWSLVDTSHGRGLWIRFTGNASISVHLSRYPPPTPLPDTSLTLTNETVDWPYAEVWIYHQGTARLSLYLSVGYLFTGAANLERGWALYQMMPVAAPA